MSTKHILITLNMFLILQANGGRLSMLLNLKLMLLNLKLKHQSFGLMMSNWV